MTVYAGLGMVAFKAIYPLLHAGPCVGQVALPAINVAVHPEPMYKGLTLILHGPCIYILMTPCAASSPVVRMVAIKAIFLFDEEPAVSFFVYFLILVAVHAVESSGGEVGSGVKPSSSVSGGVRR
jgi:hypothetical protein